jgi:repressor of nif and glnA expression
MTFEEYSDRDARLCILRELSRQLDNRANERLLTAMLTAMGYSRSLEWVRTQLRKLEELGALRIHQVGEIMVAELRRAGLDHVERRSVIEGVAKPSTSE